MNSIIDLAMFFFPDNSKGLQASKIPYPLLVNKRPFTMPYPAECEILYETV